MRFCVLRMLKVSSRLFFIGMCLLEEFVPIAYFQLYGIVHALYLVYQLVQEEKEK